MSQVDRGCARRWSARLCMCVCVCVCMCVCVCVGVCFPARTYILYLEQGDREMYGDKREIRFPHWRDKAGTFSILWGTCAGKKVLSCAYVRTRASTIRAFGRPPATVHTSFSSNTGGANLNTPNVMQKHLYAPVFGNNGITILVWSLYLRNKCSQWKAKECSGIWREKNVPSLSRSDLSLSLALCVRPCVCLSLCVFGHLSPPLSGTRARGRLTRHWSALTSP